MSVLGVMAQKRRDIPFRRMLGRKPCRIDAPILVLNAAVCSRFCSGCLYRHQNVESYVYSKYRDVH